ncbi:MAG: signal peptide peptidase SppA [Flavicella sp.]
MTFVKNIFSSLLGFFLALFLLTILFVGVGVAVSSDDKVTLEENSVLKIVLDTEVKDYTGTGMDPLTKIFGGFDREVGLDVLIASLDKASKDSKIKGISIELKNPNIGITQLATLREAISEFKKSGKFVSAYANTYSQKNYYLTTVADSLFLNPIGNVEFKGLAAEVLFFKDFQDKFGVKMEVIRHGKYKSAVEPFLNNTMSASNRKQMESMVHSIWSSIVDEVSESRGLTVAQLNAIADGALGRTAKLSKEHNLVDALVYKDEYDAKLKTQLGTKKLASISLIDYLKLDLNLPSLEVKNQVAIIYAQGKIVDEKGGKNFISPGLFVKAIDKARLDDKVKAVVLRINSPGGSAMASEIIWRALELLKKEKPLVVSMGDYAASGGYYIASNASRIFANKSTITGSIGVFGMFPNVSALSEEIGVHAETVATNSSPSYSPFLPIDSKFYELTKESVDEVYTTFLNRVSEGRNMTVEEVHELAQGRVWTGKQALENGLVDVIGSLDEAVKYAAATADIENYDVLKLPKYEEELMDALGSVPFASLKEHLVEELVGEEHFEMFNRLNSLKGRTGIQMGMPYLIDIK